MATYATMKSRIATELSRADLTSFIPYAVQDAIQFYQGHKFWFNEGGSDTTTVAGTAEYSLPTDFVELDSALITVGGAKFPLKVIPFRQLDSMDTGLVQGVPQFIATYQEAIRVLPIPNAAYTMTLWYTKKLAAIANDSDTNAWTTEAEELIRTHAKKLLRLSPLHDYDGAAVLDEAEKRVLASLVSETERRIETQGTRAWW